MTSWMRSKSKAIAAAAGFALTIANAVGPDNHWAALVIAVLGVLGVHQAPKNIPIERP